MFTGIIEELGQIKTITKEGDIVTFSILSPKTASKVNIGDSVAIDGTCLTVRAKNGDTLIFDAIPETIERTTAKKYLTNTEVNLETSLTLSKGIDGHLVQGHVDGTGTISSINDKHEITITFPPDLARYLAFKGSVTINGISLTISKLEDTTFQVSLIPHTIESTNMKNVKVGDEVNIEIDLIARYLERMTYEKEGEAKYHFLKERNLI